MSLALFDLDNTLLSCDSDYEWGNFLVRKNVVDKAEYESANTTFYEQYKQGTLNIYEFCAFSFRPLTLLSMEELAVLHDEFMEKVIRPQMKSKAKKLIAFHKSQQHIMVVITATNSFITRPIVREFGIDNLIATEPKIVNGRYTTEIDGIPCFKEGKVQRLEQWLEQNNASLTGSLFYSDSFNDLPLMQRVDHAVAVDPDEKLAAFASKENWKILSLRD